MKKKSKILVTFIQIVLIAVIIFSGIKIIEWIKSNKKNKDIMSEIKENVVINNEMDSNNEEYKIDFAKLKQKNSDAIAWIKVNGTDIDFPVVKGTDNSYYLTHNFDKEKNKIRKVNKYDYSEKYYYSLGKEDDELENRISTFETYIANILKQLNAAQNSIELTKKDLEILKLYVVLQSCRNNNTSPVIKNDESGIYINNNYLFGVPLVTTQEEAVQVTTLICDEFNKIKNSNDNFDNITSQFCLGLHLFIVTNENSEFIISETTSIIECCF